MTTASREPRGLAFPVAVAASAVGTVCMGAVAGGIVAAIILIEGTSAPSAAVNGFTTLLLWGSMIGWPVWLIGIVSVGQITFDRLEAVKAGWLQAAGWGAGVAGSAGLVVGLLIGLAAGGVPGLIGFLPLAVAIAIAGAVVGCGLRAWANR